MNQPTVVVQECHDYTMLQKKNLNAILNWQLRMVLNVCTDKNPEVDTQLNHDIDKGNQQQMLSGGMRRYM